MKFRIGNKSFQIAAPASQNIFVIYIERSSILFGQPDRISIAKKILFTADSGINIIHCFSENENFNIFAAKIYKMAQINDNYFKLQAGYLFPEIGRRVREFQKANPEADIIKMGIGDVTQPLAPSVIRAFHEGVDEMANVRNI